MPSSGLLEGLTLFAENTGIVVGRTLVDPSKWNVPVLVSNFSQETAMVEPFSEVGMVAQISAIQFITEPYCRASCSNDSLPTHLQDLLDQMSRDLDGTQQRQLANVLLRYSDLFLVPGSTPTGHTDAVEHEIDTGHSKPIHCAPRRMSPQKIKKEEECVADMLAGGQIKPSDSPWSAPVVLVTKKRQRYPVLCGPPSSEHCDGSTIHWTCWPVSNGSPSLIWPADIGSQEARIKTAFATHSGLFQFKAMPFGL